MKEMLATMKGQEDVTLDGKKVNVYCNIGSPEDVAAVLANPLIVCINIEPNR